MQRISVLLMAFVLIAALSGGARAERWKQPKVTVLDFSDDAWSPGIAAQVAAFNAAMPKGVPTLVYIDKGPRPCADTYAVKRRGKIVICSGPTDDGRSVTLFGTSGGTITTARIQFDPRDAFRARYGICHELMHAVTHIPDDYTNPHAGESCVQGTLDQLGSWDIAYAAQVYTNDGGRSSGDRPHHQKRHRRH